MSQGKLDLPENLLSVETMGGSEGEKVQSGPNEDLKDQATSESSIPLSPQWLYSKPSESKMDVRAPSSAASGNSSDPNQKDGWRLEGSEEKKDWRKIAAENDSNRRWREEERDTGLLSARRDRRKVDRRADNVSAREDSRAAPSDRWHDAGNRNSGHEARRDGKWSSRWGPEVKEKESRTEKRTDADKEKEKEDLHNDSQSFTMSSRTISEREGESRDKWRPRHRMEALSTGSTPHRAAPGFGLERGRVEVSNIGFTLGRGRAVAIGRSSSASSVSIADSHKGGRVIGKPNVASETFCYPRGKLLDIYRRQKVDPSFATVPVEMQDSSSLTLVDPIEPIAFFAPEAEEEVTIMDIWKGKITSSGVVNNNSFKTGRSAGDVTAFQDIESIEGNLGTSLSVVTDLTVDTFEGVASNDECHKSGSWNHESHTDEFIGEEPGIREEIVIVGDMISDKVLDSGIFKQEENIAAPYTSSQLNIGERQQILNSECLCSDGDVSAAFCDIKSELPDDSWSLFAASASGKSQNNTIFFSSNNETKDDESGTLDDSYFYYIDPTGNTQGPFLGADIILWFEEGYFGLDLPVRSADAPEGTAFQCLGAVMPHLKLRGGFSKFVLEESGAVEGKVEPSLSSAPAPEVATSSSGNNLFQPFSKMKSLPSQLVQPKVSELEVSSQWPHTENQGFLDVTEDEEIVFPGRPGSSGNPSMKTSGNVSDASAKSDTFPSLSHKFSDSGLPLQKDRKLHPFGLLWSELDGSHSRHAEPSEMPSSLGRSVPFGSSLNDPASVHSWSDFPRQDSLPASTFQDAVASHLLSQYEPPPNRFDRAEQLISQQVRQQLQQQRNVLPAHAHFNEPFLEQLSAQNLIHHEQLANCSTPDLEHLLALQMHQQLQQQQQQRQLQLQQQHLHRQQQFLQQQKLLEERQQAQARQVLLEQLLQAQMPDSILSQSRVDPLRASNLLDQVLLERQLLQEMQERSHNPPRHFVPPVEQLAQAKFGQSLQQEQQRDLFELLSQAQHGQALEHQILHQELQARQLSMGLRPRVIGEDERHINAVWPGNENDHYRRNLAGNQRAHPSGIGQLDFYQSQQRSALEDELNQLERNHTFQDRLHRGLYELGGVPFERSLSLPAGASGINFDVHAQGLDVQDLSSHLQSGAQMATVSSSVHHNAPNSLALNQFHVSHLDTMEGYWPDGNGLQANDCRESRLQQLCLNSDQHKQDLGAKVSAEADMGLWMSEGPNDDKAKQLLMDLLHQKTGHQPTYSMDEKDGVLFEKRGPSGFNSIPSSSDHPASVFQEQEFRPNPAFVVGSYNSSVGETLSHGSAEEHAVNLEINEKLPFTSDSGLLFGGPSILTGNGATSQLAMEDFNIGDKLAINQEYLEVEGRRPRSRNSSLGVGGFYDDKLGPHNYLSEEMPINQVLAPSKGQENILLRRPPVSQLSSSQEGLSELVSDVASRGKSSLTSTEGGVQANQGAFSTDPSKKDMRFRRVSSLSDADGSEPSFMDMLKSGAKKTAPPESHPQVGASESMDGTQGGRSGRKKGKKGKQLDPSMLGFKVTSNRIMMGEIQRLDD